MALGSGADLGEALKQGSQSAALGLTSGVMNGLAKGIKSNKENANEQTETSNQNKERTSPKFSDTKMWKNGIEYKLEILYDKKSNTIWHFKYKR